MKFVASLVMIARADEYAKAMSMTISTGDETMPITIDSTTIVIQGVYNLFQVALGIYYFLVIFSFYTELKNGVRSGFPTVGGVPGVAPGAVYPPGAVVAMGYDAGGPGQVVVQTSYYQQPTNAGVVNNPAKEVSPSYEKATSTSASVY